MFVEGKRRINARDAKRIPRARAARLTDVAGGEIEVTTGERISASIFDVAKDERISVRGDDIQPSSKDSARGGSAIVVSAI